MAETSRTELRQAIDTIEEFYEFSLAYAAQGVSSEDASRSGAQLRDYLARTETALEKLADLFEAVVLEEGLTPVSSYDSFVAVVRDDARKAGAAVRLTLDQPGISSQLVDNLNASIHVRALLTDLFLLDEIITARVGSSAPA